MTKKQKQRAAVAAAMTVLSRTSRSLAGAPEKAKAEASKSGVFDAYAIQSGYLASACEHGAKHVQVVIDHLREAFPDIILVELDTPTKGAA